MRTQIALSPVQHAQAKRKAAELGISMAEYIRRLVAHDLAAASAEADPVSIIGMFSSGDSDIANQRSDAIRAAVTERAAQRQR